MLLSVALFAGEFITIKNIAVFGTPTRGEVRFPHEKHFETIDCTRCHHRYENGKNVLSADELMPGSAGTACASCHKGSGVLQGAYHRMCLKCHSEKSMKRERSGPVMCGMCHINRGGS